MQTTELKNLAEIPTSEPQAENQIVLPTNERGLIRITAASLRTHFRTLHPNAKSNEIRNLVGEALGEYRPVIDAIQQKAVADGYSVEHRETKSGRKIFTYVPPKADKEAKAVEQIRDLKAEITRLQAIEAERNQFARMLEKKSNAKLRKATK